MLWILQHNLIVSGQKGTAEGEWHWETLSIEVGEMSVRLTVG